MNPGLVTYCDSSAAVALLRPEEQGRQPVVAAVLGEATAVAGCEWITPLEVAAAISRGVEARLQADAERRWAELWRRMVPVVLDGPLWDEAIALTRARRLRSLDAIHLAAAMRIGCDRMVTFDSELASAARAERIDVIGAS